MPKFLVLQVEVITQEMESAKEANEKAPSKTMKNLVERLRNQLTKKEKEQKVSNQISIYMLFFWSLLRKVNPISSWE